MLTWELLGAAVGAGLASGREVASFFGRMGVMGYGGVALAMGVMGWLAGAELPPSWHGRWPERLWQGLNRLLLMCVGGVMLAGAGELSGTLLQASRGRLWGMAVTLILAWLLAKRTSSGLAWVSRMLLAGMTLLLLWTLRCPPSPAVLPETSLPAGLLRSVTYGGFNAALLQPLMKGRAERKPLRRALVLLGLLLTLGLAALLRHPAAMARPMPFLHLASGAGGAAFGLAQACLYLALLSTLTACLRVTGRWGLIGVCAAAALGFTGAVDTLYPLLGGGCFVMLLWAKMENG